MKHKFLVALRSHAGTTVSPRIICLLLSGHLEAPTAPETKKNLTLTGMTGRFCLGDHSL